jgi:NTP pyrophosphatase (non-canonical NTP hydrolase)
MHIREYQQWLEEWDRKREFHRVLPSHTLLHALEELGEISKLVQQIEGYRPNRYGSLDELRDELALELSDLLVMLFKVAYLCEIDLEQALIRGQAKADERYPNLADGPEQRRQYWQHFHNYLSTHGLQE